MGEKDQICNFCQDVIFEVKEDCFRIQRGYFNKYREFTFMGEAEVYHERCYNLIRARALVMEDISVQLQIPDCSERIEKILHGKEERKVISERIEEFKLGKGG